MKVLESAVLLVIGTILVTFGVLSFLLFPRPLSFSNPTFFVQALAAAGAILFALGARGLFLVSRSLGQTIPSSSANANAA